MISKTNFYSCLGKSIEKARKKKGYSMDRFIEIAGLGMSKSTLSAIENGKQQISALQLYLITEFLDIELPELLKELSVMMKTEAADLLDKKDLTNLENL